MKLRSSTRTLFATYMAPADAAEMPGSAGGEANAVDEIADILVGGEEKDDVTEDLKGEETQTDKSTDSTESDEDDSGEVTLDEIATEDEPTWSDVLGIEEDKLVFDDDGNLKGVNVKVNGEVSQVGLNDLVAGFQLNKAVTQKSQALSEEKKAFDQQMEQRTLEYNAKIQEASTLTQVLEQQLLGEYQSVDWERLRIEQPAEYAAARQDMATRAQQLQQAKAATATAMQQQQQQLQNTNLEQRNNRIREEYNKMIENNPQWTDDKVYEKDMGRLKEFCSDTYGFTDQDFKSVVDARVIELVKDAEKYRSGVKMAQESRKTPLPKFQKSGGKSSKRPSKLQKLTARAKNAKGSNKRDAQADAIAEVLISGGN